MVPDIASKGHSFKGAMAYYLHDKRQEGGANPTTAERIAWTETRNLATDDPELATRIMVATAKDADRLKAEAGIKNTGRKSNAHVYAFSLAWHPDEAGKLDRAEMVRAADSSLKALGADHLQAVLICHQDQKHPHVHVVLNRVDPATGKMHAFSNDRVILSDWANAYERERGLILTPLREEKRQLRQQFTDQAARREHVKNTPRDKTPAAMLKELGEAQKVAHRQQWVDLSAQHKTAKEAIYSEFGGKIAAAAEQHKAAMKPVWREHFHTARAEDQAFRFRELTLRGRIKNALDAAAHQQAMGQAPDKGLLSLTFNNVLSSQSRLAALQERQAQGRETLSKTTRAQLDATIAGLKAERDAALSAQRQGFGKGREDLIARQDLERGKIREAWAQLKGRGDSQAQARDDRTRTKPAIDPASRREAAQEAFHARRRDYGAKAWKRGQTRPLTPEKPKQEKAAMKDAYDRTNRIPVAPKVEPTRTVQLSTPSPAPSPAGVTRSPDRRSAEVPAVDRAAQWAKTAEGKKAMEQHGQAAPASPKKDWSKVAAPAPATKAPELAPRKDWSRATNDKPREIKPLPQRDKSRDYDRDR